MNNVWVVETGFNMQYYKDVSLHNYQAYVSKDKALETGLKIIRENDLPLTFEDKQKYIDSGYYGSPDEETYIRVYSLDVVVDKESEGWK